jgi:hypothetical protein
VYFLHQLEPDALVDAFTLHPPEGFALLEGGPGPTSDARRVAPVFAAPFDLLTTADAALRRRAASLPLSRYWLRHLRVRTAFVGSTASEYLLAPRERLPAEWAAALLRRWGRQFQLMVFKDLPAESPLLDAADNAGAAALLHACLEAGCLLVEGQALAYVPIDFPDVETYMERLSASRRKNLRRKLRSLAKLEVRRIATGSEHFEASAITDAYYALYEAVYAQSELHFDRLTHSFLAHVLRDASAGGVVFEYRRAGELIGWNLCFEVDNKLVDKYIGLSYPEARECNLYFVSWVLNLEYAIERGLTHYVAGWTDPEVKARLGARFTFTRHAVYVRNPLLRLLARCVAGRFERDGAWRRSESAA